MISTRWLTGTFAAVSVGALAACGGGSGSGSGGSSSTGGAGGGTTTMTPAPPYKPDGCQFELMPRPEYTDWRLHETASSADPKIERVRLGLGGNVTPGAPGHADPSTSIGVGWQTEESTLASQIQWGPSADPAAWPKENAASGVTWLTPPGLVNGHGDTRMHEVYLCGLTPSTTYYYRVGGGPAGQEVWSDVYSFTTTPAAGGDKVVLSVNGDARGQAGDAWRLYQKKVMQKGVNFELFSGDTVLFGEDQTEWEKWLDLAWKDEKGGLLTLGQVLTLNTNGNHDNQATPFFGNMVLPQEPAKYPLYAELFFSFDAGPVHVTVIDDSYFIKSTTAQEELDALTAWIDADLAAAEANRANVPWLVTLHHHGPFSSANHGDDLDVLRGRAALMPLYDKHHVDLDVAGHDHNYERSLPLQGPADAYKVLAQDAKGATTYLLCAGAGADAYAPGTSDFTAKSAGYDADGAIGAYAFLTFDKTTLTIEAHELRTDGTDPQIDSVTLTR
ncbi:MAG: metallophosphoesterase family protein [Polyangiaceae bacterium]